MPLPRPSSRTDHAEPAGTWTAYAPGVGPRPVNATVYGSPSTNTFTRAPATSPSGAWTTPLTVSVGAPSRARAASDSVARSVWTDAVVAAAGQGVSGRQGVLRAHGQHHTSTRLEITSIPAASWGSPGAATTATARSLRSPTYPDHARKRPSSSPSPTPSAHAEATSGPPGISGELVAVLVVLTVVFWMWMRGSRSEPAPQPRSRRHPRSAR